MTLNFYDNGLIGSIVDRNGNRTECHYDDKGRIISIIDPVGLSTVFAYQGGHIKSITDPGMRKTVFSVNAAGDLQQIINPDGSTRIFTYDNNHLLISERDARGFFTYYNYGENHRVESILFPNSETMSFEPGEVSGVINQIPLGSGTPDNPAPAVLPPEDYVTNGKGSTASYRTNEFGSITGQKDALNNITRTERDKNNNPINFVKANDSRITSSYDSRGNPVSSSRYLPGPGAPESTTYFTYEPYFNKMTTSKDSNGNMTEMFYDIKGNLTGYRDAEGNTGNFLYDSRGLLISSTDPLGNMTQYGRDWLGNLCSVMDPLNNVTTMTNDISGNLNVATDADGRITLFERDSFNRLTAVTDSKRNRTMYSYDPNGNPETVTDANGNTARFFYNEANQQISTRNPLGYTSTTRYNINRTVSSITSFNGQTTSFAYDEVDRIIEKSSPTNTARFTYDSLGNCISVVDDDSSLSFVYDPFSRIIEAKTLPTSSQPKTEFIYSYDKNGNRTLFSVKNLVLGPSPQTMPVRYEYDKLNNLISIQAGDVGRFSYVLDQNNRISSERFPNGTATDYEFDAAGQLLNLTNKRDMTPFSVYSYLYDKVGNRISMMDNTGYHNYSYDMLNRLIAATHPMIPSEQFTYDAVSNRKSSLTSDVYEYDKDSRLLEDSRCIYSYDFNGNVTRRSSKSSGEFTNYMYDSENQLVRVEIFNHPLPAPPSKIITYRYDGLGRRIEKNVDGSTRRYVYDGQDMVMEFDGSNNVTASYTHGSGIDNPIFVRKYAQNYYYTRDGSGNITQLTDEHGNVVQTYAYDSFGNIVSGAGNIDQPYKFTAREYDDESGLYNYRSRYYDPGTGRFISRDSFNGYLSDPSSQNPYTYVKANPVNYADPMGYDFVKDENNNITGYVFFVLEAGTDSHVAQWVVEFQNYFKNEWGISLTMNIAIGAPPPNSEITYSKIILRDLHGGRFTSGEWDINSSFEQRLHELAHHMGLYNAGPGFEKYVNPYQDPTWRIVQDYAPFFKDVMYTTPKGADISLYDINDMFENWKPITFSR